MATIIFDFDGTIADSFDYVADFMASEAGITLSNEQRDHLRGLSMVGMARKLGYHWWEGPFLFFKGRQRMREATMRLKTFVGIPELIRKLYSEGHELFVLSSNSQDNVRLFLQQQKINKFFIEIYGNAGVFGKGQALKRLLNEQNLEINHAVYVGDELRDVEAAKSIGMRAVAVSWGFASRKDLAEASPAWLADTPAELFKILEEI